MAKRRKKMCPTKMYPVSLRGAIEQIKMQSQLIVQFLPFFSAHSAYFNISRQKIPYSKVLHQNSIVCDCFATKQFCIVQLFVVF